MENFSPVAAASSALKSLVRPVDDLVGPVGRLEALLNAGDANAPCAAVICHPYPPAGGTMHTRVVYHAAKALASLGIPVLRFNFRGVGLSAGAFGHGVGEQGDLLAAMDWLDRTFNRPLLVAGFSFGAYVALRASCNDSRVLARVALGLPVNAAGREYEYGFLVTCRGPLLCINGRNDEFSSPDRLYSAVGDVPDHTVELVSDADHFFQGTANSPAAKLPEMQAILKAWISSQLHPESPAPEADDQH